MNRVALQVRVELGVAELTVDELMQLGPGDVIVLDRFAIDPLPVFVENQLKFYGLPGESRGHRALRMVGVGIWSIVVCGLIFMRHPEHRKVKLSL